MKDKIICIRNYKKLVQADDGDVEYHWIRFYPDRLLGSMNFKRCDIREQSLYLAIFIRVRRDGDFCGKLCYPNGNPITFNDLIDDMNPKERDRTDLWEQALRGLIDKTLIYLENSQQTGKPLVTNCSATAPQLVGDCSATDRPLTADCKDEGVEQQGVTTNEVAYKNKSKNKSKNIESVEALPQPVLNKNKRLLPDPDKLPGQYSAPDLIGYFGNKFTELTQQKYPANFGKDGKIFKDLLVIYKPDMICELIDIFFEQGTKDKWLKDKLNIGTFRSQASNLVIKRGEKNGTNTAKGGKYQRGSGYFDKKNTV